MLLKKNTSESADQLGETSMESDSIASGQNRYQLQRFISFLVTYFVDSGKKETTVLRRAYYTSQQTRRTQTLYSMYIRTYDNAKSLRKPRL